VLYFLDSRAVIRQEEAINDQQFISATLARLAAEDRFASVDASARFLLNHVFSRTAGGTMTAADAQNFLQPMVYNMPEVLGFCFVSLLPGEDRPSVSAFRSTPAGNEGRVFALETAARMGPGPLPPESAAVFSGSVKITGQRQMALFSDVLMSGGILRGVLFTVVDLSPVLSRYVIPMVRDKNGISMVLHEDGTVVWLGNPSRSGEGVVSGEESPEVKGIRGLVEGALSGKSSLDIHEEGADRSLLVAWNTLRMGGKRLSFVLASPRDQVDDALSGLRIQRNLLVGALILLVSLGTFFFSGKKREEEIRRSEATFRAVFDNASSGIAILDRGGKFLSCNATWEAMTALSGERLRQKSLFDLAAPGAGQGADVLQEALRMSGGTRRAEVRFARADGLSFWGDVSLTSMAADPSFPSGTTLALITDISGMKRAEDLLKQNTAALEAQKTELEKLASDQGMLLELFTLFAEAEKPEEIHRALFDSLPAIISFRNLFLCVRNPGHEERFTTLDAMGEVEKSGQADLGSEGKGIVGHVLKTGKPHIAGDLAMDPWYISHSEEAKSLVAVPASYKGRDWGVICLDSAEKFAFGIRERDLLALVGFYVALHLEEVEARAELDNKAKQLGFLHRVVQHLAAERTNEDLSRKIVDILGKELDFPLVGIFVPGGKKGQQLSLLAGFPEGEGTTEDFPCLLSETAAALSTGRPAERGGTDGPTALAVPLSFNGDVFAVLAACDERGFSPSERELLEITAEHGSTFWVLNNMLAERRHEALIDPLTQVWNRRYIMGRLEEESSRIARSGGRGTVVLVDLGDFKSINDRFGHVAGDEVLKETAALMSANLRSCDMIGRYGGDEFLLYLPDVSVDQAAAAMLRMEERAAELRIPKVDAAVVLDYGIASCPGDGDDLVSVIGIADARMYEYKARRKAEKA
jgi:diguanylate cyclase (GGDEF)-like protein/PAS domain S-box-containing protein